MMSRSPSYVARAGRRVLPAVVASVVAASLLGGCSLMPHLEWPSLPVAGRFPFAPATEPTQASAPLPAWDSFFADPRLRELIANALRNNRDLRVAVLNIEVARAQYGVRRADLLPSVGVGASGSRTPNASGGITSVYTGGLTFSNWEIDFFGRIASLSEAARRQYLASEEGRKAAQIALVAAVASTWLAWGADEELLAITRRTLDSRVESQRLVQLRFDNGATSELELRLAQSLAESARATLAQLERQRAQDFNALTLLVGAPLPADLPAPTPIDTVAFADVVAGLPSEVLTRRPDVQQAEQQLRAANANIGAARAAFFPRITLTAGLGSASSELSGLFKSGSWGWTVAPQLLLPIFDAGRNRAGLATANAQRDITLAQYEKAIQSAFREVADALAARITLDAQLAAQRNVTEAETVRTQLAQLRYDNGVASTLDLLDAQRSLFTAQQALVQTRLAQLQNQVQLYKVLGGGWHDTVAR